MSSELGTLLRRTADSGVARLEDHMRRLHRGTMTAIQSEALQYLRDNNISEELLSKDEYEQLVDLVEDPQKRSRLHNVAKHWFFRQLRRKHHPGTHDGYPNIQASPPSTWAHRSMRPSSTLRSLRFTW